MTCWHCGHRFPRRVIAVENTVRLRGRPLMVMFSCPRCPFGAPWTLGACRVRVEAHARKVRARKEQKAARKRGRK